LGGEKGREKTRKLKPRYNCKGRRKNLRICTHVTLCNFPAKKKGTNSQHPLRKERREKGRKKPLHMGGKNRLGHPTPLVIIRGVGKKKDMSGGGKEKGKEKRREGK